MQTLGKTLLQLSLLWVVSAPLAQAQTPDFSQIGFSTEGVGTTGGAGGPVVKPANFQELKQYAEHPSKPYVILIDKEINTGIAVNVDEEGAIGGSISSTYGEILELGSNKTLVGLGDKAFFNRIGIKIQKKSNIIIRNIRFTMKHVPISKTDENKVIARRGNEDVILSDPDCISIQADSAASSIEQKRLQESRNIWIDHCEFFNEDPSVMDSKDRYDGLLDAKNNVFHVTISWNYFHDHHKGCLIGNSDSDEFEHKFTLHHNRFDNILSRQPLIRFGRAHHFNNYHHDGGGNGVDVRIDSDMLIEKNHFSILSKAVFGSDGGKARFVDNITEGNSSKKTTIAELEAGTFVPPYAYKADDVAQVKGSVTSYAGVGKISTEEYENSVVSLRSPRHPSSSTSHPTIKIYGKGISSAAEFGSGRRSIDLQGRVLDFP